MIVATGPTGPNITATSAFAANTSGTALTVLVGGTLVPLPDGQLLSPDITVNGANTVFTVTNAGRYQISYNVNTTASLASGTRLLINGAANTASTVGPCGVSEPLLQRDPAEPKRRGHRFAANVWHRLRGHPAAGLRRRGPFHYPSKLRRDVSCHCQPFPQSSLL